MATLKTQIKLRNDTASAWTTANPVLGKGEIGIEIDTNKLKIGDGTTAWSSLAYFGGNFTITGSGNTIVDASYANGVLTLTKGNRLTGSGLTADTILLGNGNYAVKTSSKTIETTLTNSSAKVPTSSAVYAAIENVKGLVNAAVEMKGTLGTGGTITALPTASATTLGDGYKVITAGTYGGQAAKVGDVFTCYKTGDSTYAWMYIPSGDDIEDTWRNVQLDGTDKLATGITSGALNLKNVETNSVIVAYDSGFTFDVKTGYTTSGKNYAIQKDDSGNLFVNVPWSTGTNSRDPGYGKITPANSTATSALTGNTTQIVATTYSEAVKFSAANKWIVLAGTNSSTAGSDELKFAHALSGVTAGTVSDGGATRTLAHGGTFKIPSITYDAAGHITATSTITLTLPSDNNTWKPCNTSQEGYIAKAVANTFLVTKKDGTVPSWETFTIDGGSASDIAFEIA